MRPRMPSAIGDVLLWLPLLVLGFVAALLTWLTLGLSCEIASCTNLGSYAAACWIGGLVVALASLWTRRPRPLLLAGIALFAASALLMASVLG